MITRALRGVSVCLVVSLAFFITPAAYALGESGAGDAPRPSSAPVGTKERSVLSLETVIRRATTHHPNVVSALEAVTQAERDLQAAHAAFTPRVSLEGTPLQLTIRSGELTRRPSSLSLSMNQNTTIGLSTSASVSLSGSDLQSVSVGRWSVGISYPLFQSSELNSNNLAVRQAQIELEASYRSLAQAEASAVVDALQLYHRVVTAGHRLQEARDTLAQTQIEYQATLERLALDIATDVDRINAELAFRRQELAADQAKRTYLSQWRSLLNAIGLTETTENYLLEEWPELMHPAVAVDHTKWLESAREFDPGVWQRQVAVETAQLQLRAEQEQTGFTSSLSASVGRGGQDGSQSPSQDSSTTSWSVQVQASYPLLDGGARERSLLSREESVRRAEQAYSDELRAFEQRMQELIYALEDAEVNALLAELEYEKASIELAQARSSHSRGMITSVQLQQAERAERQAYDELQAARLSLYSAMWNVEIAAGRTLDLSSLWPASRKPIGMERGGQAG